MDVRSFQENGVVVYQVSGEVNISSSPDLKKLFEKQPPKKLVIDLEKVAYIDSSGLATLVEMLKRMKSQGGLLALSGLSEKVRSLFEITKLDKLFIIVPTQAEGVAKVQ